MEASGGMGEGGEIFEVSSSPETAAEAPAFEGMNVCRAAALSLILGKDAVAVRQVADELQELGYLAGEPSIPSDDDPIEAFADIGGFGVSGDRDRVADWQAVSTSGSPQAAITFLVDVLGSRLERESAAAAAALWRYLVTLDAPHAGDWESLRLWEPLSGLPGSPWRDAPWARGGQLDGLDDPSEFGPIAWDPIEWRRLYTQAMFRPQDPDDSVAAVGLLASWRISRALRSRDTITRSLSMAVFLPTDRTTDAPTSANPPSTRTHRLTVSTMIHGTWGWKGDWWRPRSDFHEHIRQNVRANLYSRGAKFSWSGAYRESHRAQAAIDFLEWIQEIAPGGLETVFAHSYGGEVAARSRLIGAPIEQLVFLSVPATEHVAATVPSTKRVVDIRLRFDPILALARKRQRLEPRPNVTQVLLSRWCLDHRATHHGPTWEHDDIARRAGL
jgi:hypothetical protein